MSQYICQRCGKCCNDLIQQDRGILRGLSLLPEEAHLFPEALVKPYLGIGRRPHESKFQVIAYQLITETCPHLAGNGCSRYDERPITCRQFPFSLDLDEEDEPLLGVDMNCPAAVELINNTDGQIEFTDRDDAEKLLDLKRRVLENPRRAWVYDLATMKWVRFDKMG
jgi:Fe-S-cluster containining protein